MLLLSSALLVSITKNIVAQEEETDEDYTMTEQEMKTKITDSRQNIKFIAIVEAISNLDLKETVKAYLSAEVLQKTFKYHAKNLIEQQVTPTK